MYCSHYTVIINTSKGEIQVPLPANRVALKPPHDI